MKHAPRWLWGFENLHSVGETKGRARSQLALGLTIILNPDVLRGWFSLPTRLDVTRTAELWNILGDC